MVPAWVNRKRPVRPKMLAAAGVRQLDMRPSELFNFQRSVSHCSRHLTMRTAGFGTTPRILFTRRRAWPGFPVGPVRHSTDLALAVPTTLQIRAFAIRG